MAVEIKNYVMLESEINYNLILRSVIIQGAIIARFPLKD